MSVWVFSVFSSAVAGVFSVMRRVCLASKTFSVDKTSPAVSCVILGNVVS
jgi:ABC-type branched-subunit amino acid transport system permease subunit